MRKQLSACLVAFGTGLIGLVHCGDSGNDADGGGDSGTADGGVDGNQADDSGNTEVDSGNDAGVDSGIDCTTGAEACPGTLTCCSGKCVDTTTSPKHCGACGVACSATQFCSGTACTEALVSNVCQNPKGTVVLDDLAADQEASRALGVAIAACTPAVTVAPAVDQFTTGILEPNTNRPILGGGNTFIVGGGPFGQKGVGFLDSTMKTHVFDGSDAAEDGMARFRLRSTGSAIFEVPKSTLSATHDYFVIQTVVEPESGTLVFSAYGFNVPGTQAAAFYFASTIRPAIALYTNRYYVFEWSDTDSTVGPSAADTFTPRP